MKTEVWGLLGLCGAAVLFLAAPDAAEGRDAMWSVVTAMVSR